MERSGIEAEALFASQSDCQPEVQTSTFNRSVVRRRVHIIRLRLGSEVVYQAGILDAGYEVKTKNRAAVKRHDLYPKLETKYAFCLLSYSFSRR